MKDTCYIVFNSRGIARMNRKNAPSLNKGEFAVKIDLNVPAEVFAPPVTPTVALTVPIGAIRRAPEPTAEVEVDASYAVDGDPEGEP